MMMAIAILGMVVILAIAALDGVATLLLLAALAAIPLALWYIQKLPAKGSLGENLK